MGCCIFQKWIYNQRFHVKPFCHTSLFGPFFVTDGSKLFDGRVGGALAIRDYDTLEYKVHPICCPIRLGHSLTIEMNVAWITPWIRKKLDTQDGLDSQLQSDADHTAPIL